jgi:hypothetical protein
MSAIVQYAIGFLKKIELEFLILITCVKIE